MYTVDEAPEVEVPLPVEALPCELPELPLLLPDEPLPEDLEVVMPLAADAEDEETRLAMPFAIELVGTQFEVEGCEKAAVGVDWPETPFVYETTMPLAVYAPVKYCWKVEVEPLSRT